MDYLIENCILIKVIDPEPSVIIPDSVRIIGSLAFLCYENITKVIACKNRRPHFTWSPVCCCTFQVIDSITIFAPRLNPVIKDWRSQVSEISRLQSSYFSKVSFCSLEIVAMSFSSFLLSNPSNSFVSSSSFETFSWGNKFP